MKTTFFLSKIIYTILLIEIQRKSGGTFNKIGDYGISLPHARIKIKGESQCRS